MNAVMFRQATVIAAEGVVSFSHVSPRRAPRDEAEAAEGVRCPAAEDVREGTALPRLVVLALADAWRKVVAEPETAWWK